MDYEKRKRDEHKHTKIVLWFITILATLFLILVNYHIYITDLPQFIPAIITSGIVWGMVECLILTIYFDSLESLDY